ncbi:dienelactone hydrolase [Halospina denitrificans]|uniref:Dienelactone hydrolase n=1 Tax=Halospina denitrificans TaxID=332522 RepID=A0A4R7JTT2_9GAMM|nr:alpha/beta family hydrolase [Halospina denitrificans]TDT41445.1 dienelactone hydrolase [Halospina denitrificans]
MTIPAPESVIVNTPDSQLNGDLTVPPGATGVVVFAHGSGSSRFSRRNRDVAQTLNEGGLATLLMDLLTAEEDERDRYTREYRFDIAMLGRRLVGAVDWLAQNPATHGLPIGCFGASTGAAAALIAAAERPQAVSAVVSRGGRADLAGDALTRVRAPTLLIVGGRDQPVIDMNLQARSRMQAVTELEIVDNATHLFEEPGALEQVAGLARDWFQTHCRD